MSRKIMAEIDMMKGLATVLPSRVKIEDREKSGTWFLTLYGWGIEQGIGYRPITFPTHRDEAIGNEVWSAIVIAIEESLKSIRFSWEITSTSEPEGRWLEIYDGDKKLVTTSLIRPVYPFKILNIYRALLEAFIIALTLRPNAQHNVNFKATAIREHPSRKDWCQV